MHTEGQSRVHISCCSLANTELVHNITPTVGRSADNVATKRQFIDNSSVGQGTSTSQKTPIDGMSLIRKCYTDKKISRKATNIILAAWRSRTQLQYSSYIKKWFAFCNKRQINPVHSILTIVLDYLTFLFERGLGI